MMHKSAVVNARIEPSLKTKAENILHKTGLSGAEAIRLFYTQVCLNQGLPFLVRIPNEETQKAISDASQRKTKKAKSVESLFEEWS
jgi:DNA-damage-inducible protein J